MPVFGKETEGGQETDMRVEQAEKAMQNLALIRKICYNLMKLDTRFDKKKKMTYKKMSMLYTYHLEYVQELIFQKIAETI